MYSDAEDSVYKVLKYSLQETLGLTPIIIPITLFCGCSLAGIVDSNTAGGMDVCLLWVLFVVR